MQSKYIYSKLCFTLRRLFPMKSCPYVILKFPNFKVPMTTFVLGCVYCKYNVQYTFDIILHIMSYQRPSLSSKVVKIFYKETPSLANHHSLGTYNALLVILYCYALQNKQSHRNPYAVWRHTFYYWHIKIKWNISKMKVVTRILGRSYIVRDLFNANNITLRPCYTMQFFLQLAMQFYS
jgi:hypothetical protein